MMIAVFGDLIYSYVFDDFDNPVYELKNTIQNGDIDYNYDDI